MKYLNDAKVTKNVFTIIVYICVYGAALVYFGLFKHLDLKTVVILDIGALSIIGLFGVKVVNKDVTQRTFITANTKDEELAKTNDEITEVNDEITNDILGQEYVDNYNADEQKIANKKLTNFRISKLRKKLRKLRVRVSNNLPLKYRLIRCKKTKSELITYFEDKIKLLEDNEMIDYKYKPIDYDDIISDNILLVKPIDKNKGYTWDPRKDPIWTWGFSILKVLGIGATAIPFGLNAQDWTILIPFYIGLTVSVLYTVFKRSFVIMKRVTGPYKQIRKNKLKFMKKIRDYINDKEASQSVISNQESTDKALILKEEPNIVFDMDGDAYFVHEIDFSNPMESYEYGYGDSYISAYDNMKANRIIGNSVNKHLSDITSHFEKSISEFNFTTPDNQLMSNIKNKLISLGYKVIKVDNPITNQQVLRINKGMGLL